TVRQRPPGAPAAPRVCVGHRHDPDGDGDAWTAVLHERGVCAGAADHCKGRRAMAGAPAGGGGAAQARGQVLGRHRRRDAAADARRPPARDRRGEQRSGAARAGAGHLVDCKVRHPKPKVGRPDPVSVH
ncbi:hypothetical protein H4R21_006769, partial [Coemansia helicoidea]